MRSRWDNSYFFQEDVSEVRKVISTLKRSVTSACSGFAFSKFTDYIKLVCIPNLIVLFY